MEDDLTFDTACCCCGSCATDDAYEAPVAIEPEPLWEEPTWVEPEPLWEEPVAPAPVVLEPAPVVVEPAPIADVPPSVYTTPAPVVSAPAPVVPAPAPVAPLVGGSTFSDAITVEPTPSVGSIVGGTSWYDDISVVDANGMAADASLITGPTFVGGGTGATSGLLALTEVIADRQAAHSAALDAMSAAGVTGSGDPVIEGLVTSQQLAALRLSERNLNDVMSPLWHSSDMFDPYSPRYPGRA